MNGLKKFRVRLCANSERYVAVNIESGTANMAAITVTKNVPIMNGNIPNAPFRGCQSIENNTWKIDLSASIGLDLRNSPRTISASITTGRMVRILRVFPARRSFSKRSFRMAYLPESFSVCCFRFSSLRLMYPAPSTSF